MALKKKKEHKRQKPILPKAKKAIKIVLAVCAVLLVFFSIYIGKDFFVLKRVEIKGNERLSSHDVLRLAQLKENENLFFISKDRVRANIEKSYLLKVLDIKLKLPDMLSITVEEKKAIVILEYGGVVYEITEEYNILKEKDVYSYDVPYLTGFELDSKDNVIGNEYTKYIISTLASLYKNERYAYDIISEINASQNDLLIYPRGYKITILTEKYVPKQKLVQISAILQTLSEDTRKALKIDFRFDEALVEYN